MQITRLRIKNYRGIETLDAKIGGKGAIAKGANAKGKTSVLRAIRAALAARDIGPDAIREGADKAEILVDLDDVTVKRVITPSASSLTVETSARDRKLKPQNYLTELLGTSPLDPLDLFLAKPRDRRAIVLASLPSKVTSAEFDAWIPEQARPLVPSHVREMIEQLHGIDACAALHKVFYDLRAEANATAKEATNEATHLAKENEELRSKLAPNAPTSDAAARTLEQARTHLAELDARTRRSEEQERRFASTRTTIAAKRERAAHLRKVATEGPSPDEMTTASERVAALERQLSEALALSNGLKKRDADADAQKQEATVLEDSVTSLEGTISAATETTPSETEFETAKKDVEFARNLIEHASEAAKVAEHDDATSGAKSKAEERSAHAETLTAVVNRLRIDAPRELIAKCKGIEGLGIDGDDLTLDGKSIDALSGREQMRFAVEVARRANSRTKILVVDGLERLDPDSLETFVRFATSDGYQLLATRVDRGDMVLESIETNESAEAAE